MPLVVLRHHYSVGIVLATFLLNFRTSGSASCPASTQLIPQATIGNPFPWTDFLPDPATGLQTRVNAGNGSAPVQTCCPSGNVSTWSIAGTLQYSYVGQLSAYCSDGTTTLQSPRYGFNGTNVANCSDSLLMATNASSPQNGNFTSRSGQSFRQFLGAPDSADTNGGQTYSCPTGSQPIGFSASSSCYSLSNFQIICGNPGSASGSQQAGSPGGSSSLSGGAIAGIVIGVLAGVCLLALLAFFLLKRRKRSQMVTDEENHSIPLSNGTNTSKSGSGPQSSILGLDSSMQFLEEPDLDAVVSIGDLRVPMGNKSSFADLPDSWRIPLSSVRLHMHEGSPVELGRGGFGVVYRALVRRDDAALKIVKGATPDQQARLLHEIKVLELCKSSHIVQFFGYCVTKDGLILAMEYMAGGTLYDRLHRTREYQWHNNGMYAIQSIAAGVFFLHDLIPPIVHMDLKSPNCLISRRGDVKVSDVGLGRLLKGIETPTTTMGTFNWLAPEMLVRGVCGLPSDIYSLGVVLWEVCTLETPTRMLRPISVPEEGPQEVQDLIADCLREDPPLRPTIDEFCDRLARMISSK